MTPLETAKSRLKADCDDGRQLGHYVITLREDLRLVLQALEDAEWRGIDDAPRDGTPVLLGHAQAVFSGWWQKNGGNGAGWVDGSTDNDEDLVVFSPTHFRPLPPVPLPDEVK